MVLTKDITEEETSTQRFIRERSELRKRLARQVTIPLESTRGLSLDQSELYADAVVDAVVSAKMPARTEKTLRSREGKTFNPLEERWKSWFKKAQFPDPEDSVKRVVKDRDGYLQNSS